MEQLIPDASYDEESDFITDLQRQLHNQSIHLPKQKDDKVRIAVEEEIQKNRAARPDLTVHQRGENIDLEWRTLSDPFYIECKLGREFAADERGETSLKQIQANLPQLVKYKYDIGSDEHHELSKYGDHHVVITTPYLLSGNFDPLDYESGYINPAQLTRTLWKLGIGILYRDDRDRVRIDFNGQEVLYIEP